MYKSNFALYAKSLGLFFTLSKSIHSAMCVKYIALAIAVSKCVMAIRLKTNLVTIIQLEYYETKIIEQQVSLVANNHVLIRLAQATVRS